MAPDLHVKTVTSKGNFVLQGMPELLKKYALVRARFGLPE